MTEKSKNTLIIWLGPVVITIVSLSLYLNGGSHVETNNAYVKANMVSISSEISAKVVEVFVTDNSAVEAGQLLFRVDDQPYQLGLIRSQANLVKVGGDLESLKADYLNKLADLNKTKTEHTFYLGEYNRLNRLLDSNAVSDAQVAQAKYLYQNALNKIQVTTQALQVVEARLINLDLPLLEHPDYLLALAELDQAKLNLSHIDTVAPSAGIIANLKMQKGEYIIAGSPLFSLVDTSHVWIEANSKETDLTYMSTGQQTSISIDAYPNNEWQGAITSITPATGSEFSLLPPQNSTGNWVKVVQRVSVKIEIDQPAKARPISLRPGMSAEVSVDTKHSRLSWIRK